ncbi:MAG: enoyl-CoA hydratase/isomerase family protein [Promethearchaeota archaeon]
MDSYHNWIVEEDYGLCWVKLNRPVKKNAFTEETAYELDEIVHAIKQNPEIKVLIITSTSEEMFSAGADMDWFGVIDGPAAEDVSYQIHHIFGNLERLSIPVIMAVKGLCLTAGLEMAMCGDMIYAAENAKFGQIECRYGITPGGGGTQRLTRLVGPMRAKELIFSGRVIGAEEALRIGLVNAIFPLEGFDAKITKIGRKLMMNSADAISECKFLVHQATYTNEQGFAREEKVFGERFASGEPRERLKIALRQQKTQKRRQARKEKNKSPTP